MAPTFCDDDDALEALEQIARQVAASEAERLAALSCAACLRKFASAAVAQRPGKENAATVKSSNRTSPHGVSKAGLVRERAERDLQAELGVLSRQAGGLRAECARHVEGAAHLDGELSEAGWRLEEASATLESLREQARALDSQVEQLPVQSLESDTEGTALAALHVKSGLLKTSSELSRLDAAVSELRERTASEARAFREEQRNSDAVLHAEEDAASEQTEALKAALCRAGDKIEGLRLAGQRQAHRLVELQSSGDGSVASPSSSAVRQLKARAASLQDEVRARQAIAQQLCKERASASAARAEEQMENEAAVAAESDALQRKLSKLRDRIAHQRVVKQELRSQSEADASQCRQLADRVRLKERAAAELKFEIAREEEQRRALEGMEAQITELTGSLSAGGDRCRDADGPPSADSASSAKSQAPSSMQPLPSCERDRACRAEAARILNSALPRLGKAGGGVAEAASLASAVRRDLEKLLLALPADLQSAAASLPHSLLAPEPSARALLRVLSAVLDEQRLRVSPPKEVLQAESHSGSATMDEPLSEPVPQASLASLFVPQFRAGVVSPLVANRDVDCIDVKMPVLSSALAPVADREVDCVNSKVPVLASALAPLCCEASPEACDVPVAFGLLGRDHSESSCGGDRAASTMDVTSASLIAVWGSGLDLPKVASPPPAADALAASISAIPELDSEDQPLTSLRAPVLQSGSHSTTMTATTRAPQGFSADIGVPAFDMSETEARVRGSSCIAPRLQCPGPHETPPRASSAVRYLHQTPPFAGARPHAQSPAATPYPQSLSGTPADRSQVHRVPRAAPIAVVHQGLARHAPPTQFETCMKAFLSSTTAASPETQQVQRSREALPSQQPPQSAWRRAGPTLGHVRPGPDLPLPTSQVSEMIRAAAEAVTSPAARARAASAPRASRRAASPGACVRRARSRLDELRRSIERAASEPPR